MGIVTGSGTPPATLTVAEQLAKDQAAAAAETEGNVAAAAADPFAENFDLDAAQASIANANPTDLVAKAYQEAQRKQELIQLQGQSRQPIVAAGTPSADFSNRRDGKHSYQFPSAPSSFHFPWQKDKVIIPDGIYTTDNPREIAELDLAVEAGNIYPYSLALNYAENPQMVPAPPVRKNALN